MQAIALESNGTSDSVVNEGFVLLLCNNFLIVTRAGVVRFAHSSVEEYLLRSKLPGGVEGELSMVNAHAQVAETCITFLLSLEQPKWDILPTDPLAKAYDLDFSGFEMYACFYWGSHCEEAKDWQGFGKLRSLLRHFLLQEKDATKGTAWAKWNSLLWRVFNDGYHLEGLIRHRLETALGVVPNSFFATCVWGFTEITNVLLAGNPALINETNYQGKNGLFAACENGQSDIVRLLCLKEANVNQRNELWGTSLQAAAWAGNTASFESLVKFRAHINAEPGCYGRTIDAALRGGRAEIVTRAIEEYAEVWVTSEPMKTLSLADTFDALPRPGQRDWLRRQWRDDVDEKRFVVKTSYEFDYESMKSDVQQNRDDHAEPERANSSRQFSGLESVFPKGEKHLLNRLHMANIKRRQLFDCAKHFIRSIHSASPISETSSFLARSALYTNNRPGSDIVPQFMMYVSISTICILC